MGTRRVLITGGAGFVGANLAVALATRHEGWEILALDNLKRRGAELNLPRLRGTGVEFVKGDVRTTEDLAGLGPLDALVECSAEPSALAGVDGATEYVVHTNLIGAYHCLELARREDAQLVFLSTSRVYPFELLDSLVYEESPTRFELSVQQELRGASAAGIAEDFPLDGARTLYGATKLSAELLVAEYAAAFGLTSVVNRCGVIAGPWQMGKVDQGVFTHWLLAHYFRRELSYIGYGGEGKQVRDLVHVDDLVDLVDDQLQRPAHWAGATVNVGGGPQVSLSLAEATELCRELTGHRIDVRAAAESRPGDVRVYLSDCARLAGLSDWRPRRDARTILADTLEWIAANERAVRRALLG
jgi:CDP-paratose 2-epimerase